MARLAQHTEIAAGVVVEDNGQLDAAVEIVLDGLDDTDFPGKCNVEDIGAAARAERDLFACAKFLRSGEPTKSAVQFHELLGRERFGALQDAACLLVASWSAPNR